MLNVDLKQIAISHPSVASKANQPDGRLVVIAKMHYSNKKVLQRDKSQINCYFVFFRIAS